MGIGFMDAYYSVNEYTSDSNGEYYKDLAQEWINGNFENTTLLRTIKEETYPFNGEYLEYEVHVDSVSEVTINMDKVLGDFLSLLFKDCEHKMYRGQKVIYDEKPYLCYKTNNDLSMYSKSNIIKCNNKVSFIDKESGKIITEPIFTGWEITSTNNSQTKDATVQNGREIVFIQGNEYTSKLIENQRLLISKNKAFKITKVYDTNKEDIDEEYPTMLKLYIEWTTAKLPSDNLDLLIADYYDYDYSIEINSTDLSLLNGDIGQLTATVKLNDVTQDSPSLNWSTSDSEIVSIDSLGNYEVIGLSGSTALITCSIDTHEEVLDSISLKVVESIIETKEILINPSSDIRLLQRRTLDISYGVYSNEDLTTDVVTMTPNWVDDNYYTISQVDNIITITNVLKTQSELILVFSSGTLEEKQITITLGGII